MKRDVDLQRSILKFVEEQCPPQGGLDRQVEIQGYDSPTVLAHVQLLIEDGLIDGQVIEALTGPIQAVIRKLTSRGHDAIAIAENDTTWHKAKMIAKERGASLTFNVLIEIIKLEARKRLGLS